MHSQVVKIKKSKEMVIPNVRTAAWSALKQRLRFRKGEAGYIKKKKQQNSYRDGNEQSICGGKVKTPD